MGAYNPEEYSFVDINRAGGMMFQIMLDQDDDAIVNGFVNVLDFKDVTMGHFLQMTPSFAKKMTVFQEEAIPIRTKGNHFVNMPAGFDKIFNMFKPIMSKKNQSRVSVEVFAYIIHNIYDMLYVYIYLIRYPSRSALCARQQFRFAVRTNTPKVFAHRIWRREWFD